MVLRRSQVLIRRLFENQHKLEKRALRFRSLSARVAEYDDVPVVEEPRAKPFQSYEVQSEPKRMLPSEITSEYSFKYDDLQVRLAAPHQLQEKPDVADIKFGKTFTDHMLRIDYDMENGGWQKPLLTPFENMTFHPASKVLHYAVTAFEGMKAYRGVDDRIRLFRPELNMQRMNRSANRAGLPSFDGEELIKCISRHLTLDQEWVPHSETSSLYIRPTILGTGATLGVGPPEAAMIFVIMSPVSSYFKALADGTVSLLADPSVIRAWPGGVGDRKLGSNYGPTLDVQRHAEKLGHHQVLWLFGEQHHITEVGAMNVFIVALNERGDKELLTPPVDGLILPGIHRHSILEMTRQWEDITVREEPITMAKVVQLSREGRLLEMFGAGTAVMICPISSISYLQHNIDVPTITHQKPIYQRIKDNLFSILYGHIDHPWARVVQ